MESLYIISIIKTLSLRAKKLREALHSSIIQKSTLILSIVRAPFNNDTFLKDFEMSINISNISKDKELHSKFEFVENSKRSVNNKNTIELRNIEISPEESHILPNIDSRVYKATKMLLDKTFDAGTSAVSKANNYMFSERLIPEQINMVSKYADYNKMKRLQIKRNSRTTHSRNKSEQVGTFRSIKSAEKDSADDHFVSVNTAKNISFHKNRKGIKSRKLNTRSVFESDNPDHSILQIGKNVHLTRRTLHSQKRRNFPRYRPNVLPPPPLGKTLGHGILVETGKLNKSDIHELLKQSEEIDHTPLQKTNFLSISNKFVDSIF
jgi:hypothetical protein